MKQRVSSGARWEVIVGYSRAVRVGPHVHVAGTTSVDEDAQVVGEDAYAQTKHILGIIGAALREAGVSLDDVIRSRMYVTNIDDWEAVGRAHGEVFANVRPAATLVEVKGLIDARMLVEIEVDAYLEP